MYKTDIEIAQENEMKPITEIAAGLGIDDRYLESYGRYKAKVDPKLISDRNGKQGKLVLVNRFQCGLTLSRRTCRCIKAHGTKGSCCTQRALPRSCFRYQGRCRRRRIRSGCPHGGYQPSFHGRHACDRRGQQPPCRNARQSHLSG